VQDEVTQQIVATLANESGRLAKAWQERTARKGTESLNAYELDLRGWAAIGPWTKEAFASAEMLLEEAIAADPEYARPYANLALILVWQVYAGLSESPDESITRARDLAKEAIARDDAESWLTISWRPMKTVGPSRLKSAMPGRSMAWLKINAAS
jgi:adenylate cyclase